MNLQQLTIKVQQLTQQLQQTQDLAKKISELPLQSILDPASLLHVSRNGISEKLTVQKIIESASSLAFNRLLYVGDFILDGNSFTVPELAQWLIENVIFQNALSVSFNVPFSASARIRRDVIFGNNQGQILRQVGLEISNDGIEPPKPAIPPNTVEITSFTVTDSVIGLPDAPIIGVDAITKLSQGWLIRPFSGSNVRLTASEPSKSYALTNDDLVSIEGITTTGFSNEFEWDGQEIVLFRDSNTPFTILHGIEDFGLMPFIFTSGNDFIMAPKSFAKFKRRDNKIYLISYNENFEIETLTLDQVLDASLNTTTRKIVQTLPLGSTGNGFQTNAIIKTTESVYADYFVNANLGMATPKITFSNNSPNFSNGVGGTPSTQANKLLYYSNADGVNVPTTFTDRQLPDANWVNARLALKANLAGGNVLLGDQTINGLLMVTPQMRIGNDNGYIQIIGLTDDLSDRRFTFESDPSVSSGKNFAIYAGGQLLQTWLESKVIINKELEVNGNAKLNGLLFHGQFTTGTQPAHQQGTSYYNTSIGKMKIGGVTGWETISST